MSVKRRLIRYLAPVEEIKKLGAACSSKLLKTKIARETFRKAFKASKKGSDSRKNWTKKGVGVRRGIAVKT